LLKSTSTVQKIKYETKKISFTTFDNQSEVVLRLVSKPKSVTVSGKTLKEMVNPEAEGYVWKNLEKGGVLKLNYSGGNEAVVLN